MTNTGQHTRELVVDVWSDIMCPFCYIGDTLLDQAVADASFAHHVTVRYHSYQLMPHLPADHAISLDELFERERRYPPDQARAMNAHVTDRAAELGLELHLDRAQAINTRTAHRLIHHADYHDRQHAMVQRLFRAYFTEGLNIGDHTTLTQLAADVGLDPDAALHAITTDAYVETVEADTTRARQLGISGVPFFVLDNRYAISGAQPLDVFHNALSTAWSAQPTA